MAENDKKDTNSDVTIDSQPETAAKAKTGFVHTTAFKCVIVLLIIVVVCAVFLTIFNALFEVTDQERTDRAAKKIYGEKVTTQQEMVDTSVNVGNASVNLVYTIKEYPNDYLINVTGKGGYSGGTVTCYVVVTVTNGEISIGNISISENDGQSFISNIKDSYLEEFAKLYGTETTNTDEYHVLYTSEDGFYINMNSSTQIATGASYSWTAVCNAVNGAVSYVEQVYLHIEASSSGYDEDKYEYTQYINLKKSSHVVNGTDVTYTIVTDSYTQATSFTIEITVGAGAIIKSYKIISNGSTDVYGSYMMDDIEGIFLNMGPDDVLALIGDPSGVSKDGTNTDLQTGATYSNFLCAYAALFATANYEQAIADGSIGVATDDEYDFDFDYTGFEYVQYIDADKTSFYVIGNEITYTIVTATYENANPFTVTITVDLVDCVPTIQNYVIEVDGSNNQWSEGQIKSVQSKYIGLTLDGVIDNMQIANGDYIISEEIYDSDLYNGSSESNTLCARAALFALANHGTIIEYYSDYKNTEYINITQTSYYVVGNKVTYTVVTGGYIYAHPFTVEITVAANTTGTPYIESLSIIVDGSNYPWDENEIDALENAYKNLTYDDITECLETGTKTTIAEYDDESGSEPSLGIWKTGLDDKKAGKIYNGSSESCYLVAQAALFALANYNMTVHTEYDGFGDTEYINLTETTYNVIGDSVVFTVVTGTFEHARPFTVEVTVGYLTDDGGKKTTTVGIISLSVIVDGSNELWTAAQIEALESQYKNLIYTDITDALDTTQNTGNSAGGTEESLGIWKDTLDTADSIYNGSSESCFLVAQAALFALANYNIAVHTEYDGFGDTEYINLTETTYDVIGDAVIFTVVTGTFEHAHPFTVEVTVGYLTDDGGNKTTTVGIISLSIIVDGSNELWTTAQIEALEGQYKNLVYEDITDALDTSENTGNTTGGTEASLGIWKETLDTADSIYNGSSESCYLVAQAAMFALKNYGAAMATVSEYKEFNYTEYINLTETSWEINDDGTVTYTVVTGTAYHAHPFTIEITVGYLKDEEGNSTDEVGVISLTVIVDGSNEKWSYGQIYLLGQNYVGKTIDDINNSFRYEGDEDKDTSSGEGSLGIWKGSLEDDDTSIYNGSSESCFLVAQAALFALANFAAIMGQQQS